MGADETNTDLPDLSIPEPPEDSPEATLAGDPVIMKIGKYPIYKKIGKGAMGEVWLGHHPDLDIDVAIKTLAPHLALQDPGFVNRFVSEARTAAKISHQNVVHIYDAGTDSGTNFIVMEYVAGGNVRDLVEGSGGYLEVERALDVVIGAAQGLEAAARHNIIHRDIKPENIMLDEEGTPKLADLGLAKQQVGGMGDTGITATGSAVGTPSYMAPEQAQNAKDVDGRADIYSLGATLYRIVTGELPFAGTSAFTVMMKHVREPLVHPQTKRADLPDNLCAVICKMMEKQPDDRYQTITDLLKELRAIRDRNAPVEELMAANINDSMVLRVGEEVVREELPRAPSPEQGGHGKLIGIIVAALLAVAAIIYVHRVTREGLDEIDEMLADKDAAAEPVAADAPPAAEPAAPSPDTDLAANVDTPAIPSADHSPVAADVSQSRTPASVPPADSATTTPAAAPPNAVATSTGSPVPGNPWTVPTLGLEFLWIPSLTCWAAKYETTNGEYCQFAAEHDSGSHEKQPLNGERQPVVHVSYEDATAFAAWLTERERKAGRLDNMWEYRLPNGKEWTALATCGETVTYPWGNDWPPTFGNYSDAAAKETLDVAGIGGYNDQAVTTCPVEQSGENRWGLFGVGGNVWEWTTEQDDDRRIIRGASWYDDFKDYLTCECRDANRVTTKREYIGFRLLLALPE